MTLLCRPRGRGNWRIVTLTVSMAGGLFAAQKGSLISIAGFPLLRIVEVRP